MTALLAVSLVTTAALLGCATTQSDRPLRSRAQSDVARVHVGVTSVHTWESLMANPAQNSMATDEEWAIAAVIRDSRPSHQAYVVRVQLTLLPQRRHSPYDATVTLGFSSPRPADGEDLEFGPGEGVSVLPIFSTDNLEASFNARSAEDMLSLSAALAIENGGISKGLGFDAFSSAAQSQVYARDSGAPVTVRQLGENNLLVRMPAIPEASGDHAMVPRNHHITLLLTVPRDAPAEVEVSLLAELEDRVTGEVLLGPTDEEIQDIFAEVLESHGLDLEHEMVQRLLSTIQRGRTNEFFEILNEGLGPDGIDEVTATSLFRDLVARIVYAGTRFQLQGQGSSG